MTEAAPAQPVSQQPALGAENPGRTMGIVGLVLAFFPALNVVGLILSIVGLNKSKKAGFKNGPALAGIIVSIVTIIVSIIVLIAVIALVGLGVEAYTEFCQGLPSGDYELEGGGTVTCAG